MCEFHGSNCNGLGDIWWTDKCIYFSGIYYVLDSALEVLMPDKAIIAM